MTGVARPRRSLLFTPATRPAAFDKALASGADIVCIDLEDAVPPAMKDAARPDALGFLLAPGPDWPQHAVRINAPGSRAGLADLLALADAAPGRGMVMVPKVADAGQIRQIDAVLTEAGSDVELAALIETLDGLEQVSAIAEAAPRLRLLVFGAVDLSAEMGCDLSDPALAYARGRIVHAARRAGLDVMDVPSLDFRNVEAVRDAAQSARRLGFTGKAAIHPATLDVINAAFTPTRDEVARAEAVIAAFEASPNGLAVVDGQLIEAPVIKAMQRQLAIARVIAATGRA